MDKKFRIYNLYPKLIGKMDDWISHFDRIKSMNFDWIYFNPINAPGFSGSDYAIKNYYHYHPLFVKGEMDFSNLEEQKTVGDMLLAKVCSEASKRGMAVMLDLVINHTAIDSELIKTHPEWYMKNDDGSIKNPGALDGTTWVTWGDLAQIDNENSVDKDNLWEYWLDMIIHYCDLGVRGFRCDAAYHVTSKLWEFLIAKVKEKYPDAKFVAETLGCQTHELIEVASAGFDILMNSFKWWNYKDEWFMRLYSQWAGKYPSLTFPENHDTVRLADELNGNVDLIVMKYALSSYFCTGIAITVGFEYGFRRKIDVVKTNPSWWENSYFDISEQIRKINEIKGSYKVFNEDNIIEILNFGDDFLFGFTKMSQDGGEKVLIIANTDGFNKRSVFIGNIYSLMSDGVKDVSHGHRMDYVSENLDYNLNPGEVKVLYTKF